jgi:2-polyprenyl-6-methoxyphenol hydroxylase-like FAD-dependent oxidoreductase
MAFPLSTLQAEHYSQHRLALIGEAAHSIHPMAGLGVNSGLADAILLANNVIFSKKTGNDIG